MIEAQQSFPPTPLQPIKPAAEVMMLETEEGCVLIHLANDHHYGLDAISKHIWQLVSAYGDVEAVVTQMLMEYDVDEANLRQDLDHLFKHWRKLGLLEKPTSSLPQTKPVQIGLDPAAGNQLPPNLLRTFLGKLGLGQRLGGLGQKLHWQDGHHGR